MRYFVDKEIKILQKKTSTYFVDKKRVLKTKPLKFKMTSIVDKTHKIYC